MKRPSYAGLPGDHTPHVASVTDEKVSDSGETEAPLHRPLAANDDWHNDAFSDRHYQPPVGLQHLHRLEIQVRM